MAKVFWERVVLGFFLVSYRRYSSSWTALQPFIFCASLHTELWLFNGNFTAAISAFYYLLCSVLPAAPISLEAYVMQSLSCSQVS